MHLLHFNITNLDISGFVVAIQCSVNTLFGVLLQILLIGILSFLCFFFAFVSTHLCFLPSSEICSNCTLSACSFVSGTCQLSFKFLLPLSSINLVSNFENHFNCLSLHVCFC